ncbi:hypothetical protein E3U43_008728 [Xyrichtys novacula]|uniref:Apolipoprotein M n=1 Tax=Xyrichtys novacula TaxID=13765 RepID=A0AAV1EXK0_XYRNO|nr:hypothetical protein E3U43_008728 [Xyrichtys novacula]
MFVVFAIALLCFVSVSSSAPLACEDLVRPLDQMDPHLLSGRWVVVAGSLNDSSAEKALKDRDSVAIDFYNSSYTQSNMVGGQCRYHTRNVTMDNHIVKLYVGTFNFTGTFFSTSCPDCLLLTLDIESPTFKSVDFYLFSRRREVGQKEIEEFRAQVECLNLPPPVIMDPTKELCPEQTAHQPEENQNV